MFQQSLLREFLLTKLINAEISCYKAQQFSRLEVEEKNPLCLLFSYHLPNAFFYFSPTQLRTRCSLLENLQADLSTRSRCMMGDPSASALSSAESVRGATEGSGGFIENFKVSLKPGLPTRLDFISLHFSSECPFLESHQSAEPLF